jgi:hypothetical protein
MVPEAPEAAPGAASVDVNPGSEPTVATTPQSAPAASKPALSADSEPGAGSGSDLDAHPDVARLRKQLSRQSSVIKDLRGRVEGAKPTAPIAPGSGAPPAQAPAAAPAPSDDEDAIYKHPAVASLQKAEDGLVYDPEVKAWLPPGQVIKNWESSKTLAEITAWRNSIRDKEEQDKINSEQNNLRNDSVALASLIRAESFKSLPQEIKGRQGDVHKIADDIMFKLMDSYVSNAHFGENKELTGDLIYESGIQAKEDMKTLAIAFQLMQKEADLTAELTAPVGIRGGSPATPSPKQWADMSSAERDAADKSRKQNLMSKIRTKFRGIPI